jgi:hypothetical protein
MRIIEGSDLFAVSGGFVGSENLFRRFNVSDDPLLFDGKVTWNASFWTQLHAGKSALSSVPASMQPYLKRLAPAGRYRSFMITNTNL